MWGYLCRQGRRHGVGDRSYPIAVPMRSYWHVLVSKVAYSAHISGRASVKTSLWNICEIAAQFSLLLVEFWFFTPGETKFSILTVIKRGRDGWIWCLKFCEMRCTIVFCNMGSILGEHICKRKCICKKKSSLWDFTNQNGNHLTFLS